MKPENAAARLPPIANPRIAGKEQADQGPDRIRSVVAVQTAITQHIGREHRCPGLLIAEHPRNVGVPEAFQCAAEAVAAEVGRVWVAGAVSEAVVATVRGHPEEQRALESHRAGDHQHALEEPRRLEGLVREISVESDRDSEHLDGIEHQEKCVVEHSSPAGEHQVHRDPEPNRRYPDCHEGNHALRPRAPWIESDYRPGKRFFLARRSGCRIISFEFHGQSLSRATTNWRIEHCAPARPNPASG